MLGRDLGAVLGRFGGGTWDDVADGIIYAANNGAHVISLSLGGPPGKVVENACRYAIRKGCVVVAAAGNSSGTVGYPAAYPGVLAVSSVGPSVGPPRGRSPAARRLAATSSSLAASARRSCVNSSPSDSARQSTCAQRGG